MDELEYQKGDVIFQEGDRSDSIYMVLSGSVEILKSISGQSDVVGTISAGGFVGEIASLIDRRRSTMARVAENGTSLKVLEKDNFLRLVSKEPDTAYSLLTRMCERLHTSSRRASDNTLVQIMRTATHHGETATESLPSTEDAKDYTVTVFPESQHLSGQISEQGVTLDVSPFIIGRKSEEESVQSGGISQWFNGRKDRRSQGERRSDSNLPKVHLQLTDTQPYRLSRIHFLIQKMQNGGFIVRDLGSTLGTQVNDSFLGTEFPKDFEELNVGENVICAGGGDSPFRFCLVIE